MPYFPFQTSNGNYVACLQYKHVHMISDMFMLSYNQNSSLEFEKPEEILLTSSLKRYLQMN